MKIAAGLLCVQLLMAQAGGRNADDSAVREMVKRYADARGVSDPKAISALFTDDADQLVSNGEWRRGKDALVKGMLASSARETGRRILEVEAVRFLGRDVAIADARYEIGERKMWSTFVMRRGAEGWRIEAIRNMAPTPPSAANRSPQR